MADPVAEHIAALRDEDWAIREEAAALLGTFKDSRAVGPLVTLLRDRDRSVREAAIGALRAIGAPSVEALGACLRESDLAVQESASAILSTVADRRVLLPLIEALGSGDWIVRMHAAKALGRIGAMEAVAPLVPLLQDKVKAVREETAAALASIGEAAIPALLDALRHDEWLVRLHAVESLGKTKSPRAVEPLLSVLFNDRDSAVREDAVRALGEIGDPQAVEFLFAAMREPGLRTLAVEALGRIGDRRAVPVFAERIYAELAVDAPLRDGEGLPAADHQIVLLAARAIARLEGVEAWLSLRPVLQEDGSPWPAEALAQRLRTEIALRLDALGMTPRARAALGLDLAARLVVLSGGAFWCVALFALSRAVLGDTLAGRFAVLFGVVLSVSYSPNTSIFVLNENFATARSWAMPSGLLAVPGRGSALYDSLAVRVQQDFPTASVVHPA